MEAKNPDISGFLRRLLDLGVPRSIHLSYERARAAFFPPPGAASSSGSPPEPFGAWDRRVPD